MPRDSSGNYTLPAGNPVVDGTIIDVNWANPTMQDVAVQMNNLITRNGLLSATAPIKFSDGTVGLPGITWSSEPSSGLYRPSANVLGMAISGVQRQRWTTTGTAITGTIDLTGTLGLSGTLSLTGPLNVTGNSTFAGSMFVTGLGETLRLATTATRGTGNNYLTFADPTGNKANIGYGAGFDTFVIVQALNADMSLCTSNTERMRIDATGLVGIGRTPGTKLDVAGIIRSIFTSTTYTPGFILESSANNTGDLSPAITFSANNTNAAIWSSRYVALGGDLVFATQPTTGGNPVERMRITADGTTLVGTTTPAFAVAGRQVLELNGASSSLFGLKVGNTSAGYFYSDGTDAFLWNTRAGKLSFGSNNTERMQVDNAGNVGIGMAPSCKLQVLAPNGAPGVLVASGSSSSYTSITVGRTVAEGYFGVAGVANNFFPGSAPGDSILVSGPAGSNLWLATPTGASAVIIGTAGTERMRFGGNGYTSIGTTSLDSTFLVSLAGIASLRVGFSGGSTNYYDANTHNFRNGGAVATMTLNASGQMTVAGNISAGGYLVANDPGAAPASIPLGGIFGGQAVGTGWNSVPPLGSIALSGTDFVTIIGFTANANVTSGTVRLLSKINAAFSMFMRVA